MVKGGFQGLDITGVDLTAQSPTLPGAYAACAAADGKPIRVLTADGAIQCSVKKVSTNYVLAGVTGDGKILSITVGSTDGISVSETEIPSAEESDYIPDYGNRVDLLQYNAGSLFKAPKDGYVKITIGATNNTSSDGVTVSFKVKNGSSTTTSALNVWYNSSGSEGNMVFIKKGVECYAVTVGAGTGTKTVSFIPLLKI